MTAVTGTMRGPYAKSAEVQGRILAASMEVFGERGYRATTVKEIAERAGISQRGLVHHFATKEELLTAVLARHDQEIALLVPNATGMESLVSMLRVVASNAQRPGIVELYLILAVEAIAADHPAHGHYRRRYETFRRYISEVFDVLRAEGSLLTNTDSDTLAGMFTGLLDGLQVQWMYDRDSVDIDATLRNFLSSVVRDFPLREGG